MFLDYVVPLCQELLFVRKLWPREIPCRVLLQFFVAFIVPIQGREKCFGIGRVDGPRNSQFAAFLPNEIQPRIVDGDIHPIENSVRPLLHAFVLLNLPSLKFELDVADS